MKSPKAVEILFDSARGKYIPQAFGEECKHWSGVDQDEFNILRKGPENEHYWDVWDSVLSTAYYIEESTGRKFQLHQDGDLFSICYHEMSAEEKDNLGLGE